MRRLRAVLIVAALGAAGGALVGVFGFVLAGLLGSEFAGLLKAPWLVTAAAVGALWGIVLGPVLGFALLRRVPLGRAIIWTGLGALVAAVVSALVNPGWVFLGAPYGMAFAAVVLRAYAARPTDAGPSEAKAA